jgi:hypothetical protein
MMAADVSDVRQAKAAVAGASHIIAAMPGMDPHHGAGPRAVDRDAAIALIDAAAEKKEVRAAVERSIRA